MKRIYLDYAATTPIDKKILNKMMPYLTEKYGNASSVHKFGQEARDAVEQARDKVSVFLNCKSSEIIFTGSASESDNLAIKGLVKNLKKTKRAGEKIHIITTQIEHKAVFETCKNLEQEGVKVTYLPVGPDGLINLDDLKAEITPETDLVSIMYANNETGVVQEIEKIGKIIQEKNKSKEHRIYFHTDAVQAVNWLDCDVEKLNVDLLTISGHKIYGPKGVGVLYIRENTPTCPLITGGEHEWRLRAGTENVAGIVGLGFAIEQIKKHRRSSIKKVESLQKKIIKGVSKIPGIKINTPKEINNRLPNIVNFSLLGVEGEAMVLALDEEGIAASTGSACTSVALTPSHVLIAMGLSHLQAHSSLRISLGKNTTIREVDYFLKILPEVIKKLRNISGR